MAEEAKGGGDAAAAEQPVAGAGRYLFVLRYRHWVEMHCTRGDPEKT